MNTGMGILNKILINQIQDHIKMVCSMIKLASTQSRKDSSTYASE